MTFAEMLRKAERIADKDDSVNMSIEAWRHYYPHSRENGRTLNYKIFSIKLQNQYEGRTPEEAIDKFQSAMDEFRLQAIGSVSPEELTATA